MPQDMELLYQKFQTSGQPSVKLELALTGLFAEGCSQTQKRNFEKYIQLRIRPAVQRLLERDEPDKLALLAQRGWLPEPVLEDCLRYAMDQKQAQGFIWLLQYKTTTFGFRDRDLSL